MTDFFDYLFENVHAGDTVTPPTAQVIYNDASDDNLTVAWKNTRIGIGMSQTTNFSVQPVSSYVWMPGGAIVETISMGGVVTVKAIQRVSMTQKLKLAHFQVLSILAHISETMSLDGAVEAYVGTILLARVLVQDQISTKLVYNKTVVEGIRLAEAIRHFLGLDVTDTLSITETVKRDYVGIADLLDFMTIQVDQRFVMAFRIEYPEHLTIDDEEILRMIYVGQLVEDMCVNILYQSPGGNVTTWAINTRTNAVTEYQNWSFNSFASFGRKYIGSNAQGLFELNGPTDNGISTIADVMSGYFQPADGKLAGLKGVYLGITGQGYWLLKIDTGDGREYVYQRLSNPATMTTKFDIGKGLNSRYMGWELINVEGQEFSLDSIEFVPMLRSRRI